MPPPDLEQSTERTALLYHVANERQLSALRQEDGTPSILSQVSKEEQALSNTTIGERLPYNDYTTIDWLHDLVCSPGYSHP